MFWRMRREAKKKAAVTNARRTNTGQCRTRSWTVLYTLSVSIFGAFFFMPSLSSLCHLVYPRTSRQPEVGKSNVEISKGGSKSSFLLKKPLTPEEVFFMFSSHSAASSLCCTTRLPDPFHSASNTRAGTHRPTTKRRNDILSKSLPACRCFFVSFTGDGSFQVRFDLYRTVLPTKTVSVDGRMELMELNQRLSNSRTRKERKWPRLAVL